MFKASLLVLALTLCVGCAYEPPEPPEKQAGYLVVPLPNSVVKGYYENAGQWLDDYESQGWKFISYHPTFGCVFHKDKVKDAN